MSELSETHQILQKHILNKNIKEDTEGVDTFLDNERKTNTNEPWSKLNKTIKINKINEYIEILISENNLTPLEAKSLEVFMLNCLDRKKLQYVKDVIYDKINGKITSIPSLLFNKGTRKFTLKRNEKRDSTLNSLGPGKTRKKTNISPKHSVSIKKTTITNKGLSKKKTNEKATTLIETN